CLCTFSLHDALPIYAFVTATGEKEKNTSDAERPLSIGGADYVHSQYFKDFHYTALGHLHQAHQVQYPTIRYAGSPLKYSVSEQYHQKGFYMIQIDGEGHIEVEKKLLTPLKDIRTIEGTLEEILTHSLNNDYVFITLLDENPVLQPMEKIRSVYPNVMHVERKIRKRKYDDSTTTHTRHQMDDISLFKSFY